MRPARRLCVSVLVSCLMTATALAEGPSSATTGKIIDSTNLPPETMALLQDTTERYGPDALRLQVRLLHRAIRAGSLLTAGVRVDGPETHEGRRYLKYAVDTGIVFNSRTTNRAERVSRLWSAVVVPTLRQVDTYAFSADGIELDLGCFHRAYRDQQELEQSVAADSGLPELITFRLLRTDILAFRRAVIDDSELYARSRPRIDGVPLPQEAANAPAR